MFTALSMSHFVLEILRYVLYVNDIIITFKNLFCFSRSLTSLVGTSHNSIFSLVSTNHSSKSSAFFCHSSYFSTFLICLSKLKEIILNSFNVSFRHRHSFLRMRTTVFHRLVYSYACTVVTITSH